MTRVARARPAVTFEGLPPLLWGFAAQCAAINPRIQAATANMAPLFGAVGNQLLIQKKRTRKVGRVFKLLFLQC